MTEQDEAVRQGSMFGIPANFFMSDTDDRFQRNYNREIDRLNSVQARIHHPVSRYSSKNVSSGKPNNSILSKKPDIFYERERKENEKRIRLQQNLADYKYFLSCISSLEKEKNIYIRMQRNLKTKFLLDILDNRLKQLRRVLNQIYDLLDHLVIDIKQLDRSFDEAKIRSEKIDKQEMLDKIVKPLAIDTYLYLEKVPEGYDAFVLDLTRDLHLFVDIYTGSFEEKPDKYIDFLRNNCEVTVAHDHCFECGSHLLYNAKYCPICGKKNGRRV